MPELLEDADEALSAVSGDEAAMSGLRNAIVLAALGGGRVGEAIDTFAVAVRARAVAGERQRALTVIDAAIQGEMDLHQCSFDELPEANKLFVQGLRRAHDRVAAAAGPVAIPEPTARDERPHSRACGLRQHEHGSACAVDCPTCAAGGGWHYPVAIPPTDPQCSGCSHGRSLHHKRDGGDALRWNCLVNMCGCPTFTTTAGPVATSEPMRFKDTLPIEVNEAAAVAYVRLSDAPMARTREHVKDVVLVDYGRDGYPVGVEIHFAAPVATPTTPGRVTCRRCGYFVDSDAHERTCGRAATPIEPEWRATSSDRLLGRNPDRIERHSCGCVTGWDEVYEQCVLIRCGRHSAASPVPAEQPEER